MLPSKIVISLPFAPSMNRLWRISRHGGMHKSKVYQEWLAECGALIYQGQVVPILGSYRLLIEAVRPDKRRRDIDNLIKAVSDVLQDTGLVENDCLCEEVTAKWVKSGPAMLVTVEKIDVL